MNEWRGSPMLNRDLTCASVSIARCGRAREVRAKLRAINAPTPPKTEEYRRPDSKTNQQDTEPCEICKTSIPGSNPGGASNHKSLKHQHLQSECFWSNFYPRVRSGPKFGAEVQRTSCFGLCEHSAWYSMRGRTLDVLAPIGRGVSKRRRSDPCRTTRWSGIAVIHWCARASPDRHRCICLSSSVLLPNRRRALNVVDSVEANGGQSGDGGCREPELSNQLKRPRRCAARHDHAGVRDSSLPHFSPCRSTELRTFHRRYENSATGGTIQ
jgi:hypothetical protein